MSYKTADDLYREDYKSNFIVKNVETYEKKEVLNLKWENIETNHTADPRIWGPALWFSLHISSFHYAIEASDIVIEKMKGFILGIPYLIPCQTCSEHANSYIMSKYSELDNICSGRKQLFDFFVKFHNYVNKRLNKPIISTEEAYKLYSSKINVTKLSY